MHLKIESFPDLTHPAVLAKKPSRESYQFSDDTAHGFTAADISQHADGYRLHLYRPGRACFYIAHLVGTNPVGDYQQLDLSPSNTDVSFPTVTVTTAQDVEAEDQLDSVAEQESLLVERAMVAQGVCKTCKLQGGFRSQFSVQCAKSTSSCGCVSLLRGTCPENKWTDALQNAGKLSIMDIDESMSVDRIRRLIKSGQSRWPLNHQRLPNVQEAYRQEMRDFAPQSPAFTQNERGIVVLGGGRYFDSAYVTIRMIRHSGCTLPIELWYLGHDEINPWQRAAVEPHNVNPRDVYDYSPGCKGWPAKSVCLAETRFDEVLFLDADSYPLRDPTFLFESEQYTSTGAILWPDQPCYDLKKDVWSALGIPYRDEPDVESGQIVVNRRRCWRELALSRWMNEHSDYYYKLWHGDKATFHMAWRYCGTGYAMPSRWDFLEPAMMQKDFDGNYLFVHRASGKFSLRDVKTGTGWFAATGQVEPKNRRNPKIPLEDVAFGYLEELRSIRSNGSLAIVQLSAHGDIFVMLPGLRELAKNRPVTVITRLPYVDTLCGFPHRIFEGHDTDWAKAEKIGWEIADECIVTQVGHNPAPTTYSNWAHEDWHRLGMPHELFDELPLVLERNPITEKYVIDEVVGTSTKPIILINTTAKGAPYKDGQQLIDWVGLRYQDHLVVDLGRIRAPNLKSLFGVYGLAKLLISVDTGTLHLGNAVRKDGSRIPTIAIVSDIPMGRSPRRGHYVEHMTYAESKTPIGYDRIAAAIDSVAKS